MKKYLWYCYIFIFILQSCDNNKINISETTVVSKESEEFSINKEIEKQLIRFIQRDTSIKEITTYTIEFINQDNFYGFAKSDSLLLISKLRCNCDSIGYKGIFYYKNYLVSIFDKENIGNIFYSKSILKNMPLDSLNCTNNKIISALTFIIRKDTIYEWCP